MPSRNCAVPCDRQSTTAARLRQELIGPDSLDKRPIQDRIATRAFPSSGCHAASAYLHEKGGDTLTAARLYAEVARSAPQSRRTPPPHPACSADPSSAACLSLL